MYRAKVKSDDSVVGKRWAYGDKATVEGRTFIIPDDAELDGLAFEEKDSIVGFVEVIPESVGQSTRMKDRKGEEIFQGDIVRIMIGQYLGESPKYRIHTVVSPCPVCAIPCPYVSVDTIPQWEIIGNTTDDPKLLQETDR